MLFVQFRVHPGVGCARMGNSTMAYHLASEFPYFLQEAFPKLRFKPRARVHPEVLWPRRSRARPLRLFDYRLRQPGFENKFKEATARFSRKPRGSGSLPMCTTTRPGTCGDPEGVRGQERYRRHHLEGEHRQQEVGDEREHRPAREFDEHIVRSRYRRRPPHLQANPPGRRACPISPTSFSSARTATRAR